MRARLVMSRARGVGRDELEDVRAQIAALEELS